MAPTKKIPYNTNKQSALHKKIGSTTNCTSASSIAIDNSSSKWNGKSSLPPSNPPPPPKKYFSYSIQWDHIKTSIISAGNICTNFKGGETVPAAQTYLDPLYKKN